MLEINRNLLYSIPSIDQLPKHVCKSVIDKALNKNQSETGGLAGKLELKVNARVMLTVNVDVNDHLINGQIGTVKQLLLNNDGRVSKIYIKFDDDKAGVKMMASDNYARQHKFVPIERAEAAIKIRGNKECSSVIERIQFPLMLAWACTVHKVQGLSLIKVVVSFDLLKQKQFNCGQMYVALSRVTSLDGLFLIGEYKSSAIRADPRISLEYGCMQNERSIEEPRYSPLTDNSIKVALLNTRSFCKHAVDINKDPILLETDILCLTETQLLPDQNTDKICNNLDQLTKFEFVHKKDPDKFQSLSVGFKNQIEIFQHEQYPGCVVFNFKKASFSDNIFNALLVYRKQSNTLSSFYEMLSYLVRIKNIHIILGDFNTNAQEQSINLSRILHEYDQVVTEPTHIAGSILDHVYIKKSLTTLRNTTIVKSVHFSDHDAVKWARVDSPWHH